MKSIIEIAIHYICKVGFTRNEAISLLNELLKEATEYMSNVKEIDDCFK